MNSWIVFLLAFGLTSPLLAKGGSSNIMSVGQGISSPNMHVHMNLISGFSAQNPVGAMYQMGPRISLQYINGEANDAYGVELGYGGSSWGITASAKDNNSSTTDDESSGAYIGMAPFSQLGFGVGFREDYTIVGFIINPTGSSRLGLSYSVNTNNIILEDLSSMGVGYSYVADAFTLTADASTRTWENAVAGEDDPIFVTLGFMFRADMFQFVINHELVENDDDEVIDSEETWYGIGFGKPSWHFSVYSEYEGDLAANLSFMF